MGDTAFKTQQGKSLIGSADPVGDAEHVYHRYFQAHVLASSLGAAAANILIAQVEADIEVVAFWLVSSMDIGTDANNPLIHLGKGDLADGAVTDITTTPIDTDTAFQSNTKMPGVVTTVVATRTVAKGLGLYARVATQGTPTLITETATFTLTVEYVLKN